jgi:hypothetical protein
MITVIRIAAFGLFDYWEKPVTGRLGQSCQNNRFIVMIGLRDWFSPSPERSENSFQDENSRMIADLHIHGIIQIPIVIRHTESPCLRPAVSSLGACPTPAL